LFLISILALVGVSPGRVQVWQYADGALSQVVLPAGGLPVLELSQADLDQDGQEELLHLTGGRAALCGDVLCLHPLWQSPQTWQVKQARFTNLNRDGVIEVVLLVWRPFKPWPVDRYLLHGGRINSFHNAQGYSCHVILIGWHNGKYRELWAGSALAEPVHAFAAADLDGDGSQELVALESNYDDPPGKPAHALTVWEWNGFGFTLLARAPGAFRGVSVQEAPDGQRLVFTF